MKQGMANALNFIGGAAQGGVGTYMDLKQMQNQERQLTRQEEYQKQRLEEDRKQNALREMFFQKLMESGGWNPATGTNPAVPVTGQTPPTTQDQSLFRNRKVPGGLQF